MSDPQPTPSETTPRANNKNGLKIAAIGAALALILLAAAVAYYVLHKKNTDTPPSTENKTTGTISTPKPVTDKPSQEYTSDAGKFILTLPDNWDTSVCNDAAATRVILSTFELPEKDPDCSKISSNPVTIVSRTADSAPQEYTEVQSQNQVVTVGTSKGYQASAVVGADDDRAGVKKDDQVTTIVFNKANRYYIITYYQKKSGSDLKEDFLSILNSLQLQ